MQQQIGVPKLGTIAHKTHQGYAGQKQWQNNIAGDKQISNHINLFHINKDSLLEFCTVISENCAESLNVSLMME